ncbi:YicC/YloC family endoribonuclease [Segnochrobactrum spirostomi]|nr:YicC/YloC family endoribonuclease [Segnochrobactrum spirostomi]
MTQRASDTLASMTGFARTAGTFHGQGWAWELRSVNGRSLDLRLRLPPGLDGLEAEVRARAGKRLTRGNVTIGLQLEAGAATGRVRLNAQVLDDVLAIAETIRARVGGPLPSAEALMAVRGVIEAGEGTPSEADRTALQTALLAGFDAALDGLVAMRRIEGASVAAALARHVDTIEALTAAATRAPGRTPEAIRARLAADVARLFEQQPALDEQRLHQEAALLATRADIQEEIDRLQAHVAQAREILAAGGAAGRRLDFLAQEFGREANTLCSKSNDVDLTRIGLDLKAAVDQLREQVQNLE